MRPLFVSLLLAVSQGALPAILFGSTLVDVTPQDITSQPIGFRVTAEADQHGVVNFDISVSNARSAISRYREGRLEIAREEALQKKPDENLKLQWPMVYCSVRESNENGALHFNFGLAREFVSKATFQFRNYDPSGMPSMDAYRFVLRDFVSKE